MLNLFFNPGGRVHRTRFWLCLILLFSTLLNVYYGLDRLPLARTPLSNLFALVWLYTGSVLCIKRMRDTKKSPWWLLLVLIPLIGPLLLTLWLLLGRGKPDEVDHYEQESFPSRSGPTTINDITQLNPVQVKDVFVPTGVEELQEFLKTSQGPLCIGGGRFSMGGQTSSPGATLIDMRRLNRVLDIDTEQKTVRVQAGIRWIDIQRAIDPHNLSIQVMQTYANFTVGGSLSVNAHGRYIGLGPLILSLVTLQVVLADGTVKQASPEENSELFYGVVGCYGALGIVTEVTLRLTDNVPMMRQVIKLNREDYLDYFKKSVRDRPGAIFHNADLYPPRFKRLLAVTWVQTTPELAHGPRLQSSKSSFPIHRYFYWAVTQTPLGKWRREFLFDPAFYRKNIVHWRNFEAGYDVRELEPDSRRSQTYVLQEYFVPIDEFDAFTASMAEILVRHKANVVNISVRHALPDPGSYLAWAPDEVFAFVLYYKQGTSAAARAQVAEWTRELIEASLQHRGRYYLPYQPWASPEQFHRAYPRARELFQLKEQYDPDFRLRNSLWNQYYTRSTDV